MASGFEVWQNKLGVWFGAQRRPANGAPNNAMNKGRCKTLSFRELEANDPLNELKNNFQMSEFYAAAGCGANIGYNKILPAASDYPKGKSAVPFSPRDRKDNQFEKSELWMIFPS